MVSWCPSMAWDDYVAGEEEANEQACADAAAEHGVSDADRETCESGDMGCAGCPFADNGGR